MLVAITGHGEVPMSVRAMKRAVEFLTKPFMLLLRCLFVAAPPSVVRHGKQVFAREADDPPPFTLEHEIAGWVEELGTGVTSSSVATPSRSIRRGQAARPKAGFGPR